MPTGKIFGGIGKTPEQKEAKRQQKEERCRQEQDRRRQEYERSLQEQELRRQHQERCRQEQEQRRQQKAERRRQEQERRRQEVLEAQRAEEARKAAHVQAFHRQWTEDVDQYSHFGAETLNIAMTNTLNAYFPPPAGQMHTFNAVWHGRNADGTLDFEIMRHAMVLTPDEIARRQAKQQMWQNIALNTTIAIAGGRIAGSVDRNTRAINNAHRPNYIGSMANIGPR